MHLAIYSLAAYTSFIHVTSALVHKVNAVNTDIAFLQPYSQSKLFKIIAWRRRLFALQECSETHAVAVDFEYNTGVKTWLLNFQARNRLQIQSFWRLFQGKMHNFSRDKIFATFLADLSVLLHVFKISFVEFHSNKYKPYCQNV